MKERFPDMEASLSSDCILCTGSSAGAELAFRTWKLWDQERIPLKIAVLYTQSGMLSELIRWAGQEYIDFTPTEDEIRASGLAMLSDAADRRLQHLEDRAMTPPDCMMSLGITATGLWVCINGKERELITFWKFLLMEGSVYNWLTKTYGVDPDLPELPTLSSNSALIIDTETIVQALGKKKLETLGAVHLPEKDALAISIEESLRGKPSYFPCIVDVHGTEDQLTPIEIQRSVRRILNSACPKIQQHCWEAEGAGHGFDTSTIWKDELEEVDTYVNEALKGVE